MDKGKSKKYLPFFRWRCPDVGKFPPVISHDIQGTDWQAAKGYVTTDLLREKTGNLVETAGIFMCGPPVMMKKVLASLKQLGVNPNRIHFERFTI